MDEEFPEWDRRKALKAARAAREHLAEINGRPWRGTANDVLNLTRRTPDEAA